MISQSIVELSRYSAMIVIEELESQLLKEINVLEKITDVDPNRILQATLALHKGFQSLRNSVCPIFMREQV